MIQSVISYPGHFIDEVLETKEHIEDWRRSTEPMPRRTKGEITSIFLRLAGTAFICFEIGFHAVPLAMTGGSTSTIAKKVAALSFFLLIGIGSCVVGELGRDMLFGPKQYSLGVLPKSNIPGKTWKCPDDCSDEWKINEKKIRCGSRKYFFIGEVEYERKNISTNTKEIKILKYVKYGNIVKVIEDGQLKVPTSDQKFNFNLKNFGILGSLINKDELPFWVKDNLIKQNIIAYR